MMQDSENDDFSDSDYEEVNIENSGSDSFVAYILYCKSEGSKSLKQFRMELIEKIISEDHRGMFSATSGRSSISPSPLRLISEPFPEVIPATEKEIKCQ
ncbi:hypothetical protein TNCV_1622911 [Trichonephila clavipes]|nr:hypothetical protein TNCV_1622911 [Trichonephila clavipes]